MHVAMMLHLLTMLAIRDEHTAFCSLNSGKDFAIKRFHAFRRKERCRVLLQVPAQACRITLSGGSVHGPCSTPFSASLVGILGTVIFW